MKLNLTILDRTNLKVKSTGVSYAWEINKDYLTNEKSRFSPTDRMEMAIGDFLIAKFDMNMYRQTTGTPDSIKPIFIGIVESEEIESSYNVNCRDLYNLIDFEIPTTRQSGTNVGQHMKNLLNLHLLNDPTKALVGIDVNIVGDPIAWIYQPNDPPAVTNFLDYFINIFKKYEVTWEPVDLYYDSSNHIHLRTEIKRNLNVINLKNNTVDFANWSVYYMPGNVDKPNKLIIYDKYATTNMESPALLSVWYMRRDGNLTQNHNDNVFFPTRNIVEFYDSQATNQPTFLEVAQSKLAGSRYSHEIEFDVNLDSKLIYAPDLKIGMKANIVFNNDLYNSILTGYKLTAASKWVNLRFGNIRSSLQTVLNSLK